MHETKILTRALHSGPERPCRGLDGTGPSTPIMAATLLAVSATVAPDSHHEHGLQVTAVSDVPEEVHTSDNAGTEGVVGARRGLARTLLTCPGVCQMCKSI